MPSFDDKLFPGVSIHESAYVDAPCVIGEGTRIWHFSHIMKNCTIGKNCNLGQNVVVSPDVSLGNNVKVQNNVSIYTGCIIEDDVFCGPSMVFTNVINPRSEIARKSEYRKTVVKKGATLGANSTIVCGHNVGRYAFVAAGSVITKDVPDYALMIGVPGQQSGWVCRCGERLPKQSKKSMFNCEDCGNFYREIEGGKQLEAVKENQR